MRGKVGTEEIRRSARTCAAAVVVAAGNFAGGAVAGPVGAAAGTGRTDGAAPQPLQGQQGSPLPPGT